MNFSIPLNTGGLEARKYIDPTPFTIITQCKLQFRLHEIRYELCFVMEKLNSVLSCFGLINNGWSFRRLGSVQVTFHKNYKTDTLPPHEKCGCQCVYRTLYSPNCNSCTSYSKRYARSIFTVFNQYARSSYIWVRSWNCGCLVTWFCYQLIAKPGNKTATVSWPDPYTIQRMRHKKHNLG